MSRPTTWFGPTEGSAAREGAGAPADTLVSLADITEIELLILRRMREFTIGEHSSLFHGAGFDFTGVRDWQAGDRVSAIDWPQSSLTNFSPVVVREFDQPSTSSVVIAADASASTACGVDGVPVAGIVARAIATIGMSAVFFQDAVGLVTFDDRFASLAGLRPRIGKSQVIACLEAYHRLVRRRAEWPPGGGPAPGDGLIELRGGDALSAAVGGFMRKTSLVPVVSDFLFDNVDGVMRELARLNTLHDVFLMLVDASFAFDLPPVAAGWVEVHDVETGRSRVVSRGDARRMAAHVRRRQEEVARLARGSGLDVLRLGLDQTQFDIALVEFVAERRLRRKTA